MLDPAILYSSMFSNAWPIFLLIVIILFFKSPFMTGKIGEGIINFRQLNDPFMSFLPFLRPCNEFF